MSNEELYKGALFSIIINESRVSGLPRNNLMNYISTYKISNNEVMLHNKDIWYDYILFDYLVFKKQDNNQLQFKFTITLDGFELVDFINDLLPTENIKIINDIYYIKIPSFYSPYLICNWKGTEKQLNIKMCTLNIITDLKLTCISTIISSTNNENKITFEPHDMLIEKYIKYVENMQDGYYIYGLLVFTQTLPNVIIVNVDGGDHTVILKGCVKDTYTKINDNVLYIPLDTPYNDLLHDNEPGLILNKGEKLKLILDTDGEKEPDIYLVDVKEYINNLGKIELKQNT